MSGHSHKRKQGSDFLESIADDGQERVPLEGEWGDLLEDDAITPEEDAFMRGYDDEEKEDTADKDCTDDELDGFEKS